MRKTISLWEKTISSWEKIVTRSILLAWAYKLKSICYKLKILSCLTEAIASIESCRNYVFSIPLFDWIFLLVSRILQVNFHHAFWSFYFIENCFTIFFFLCASLLPNMFSFEMAIEFLFELLKSDALQWMKFLVIYYDAFLKNSYSDQNLSFIHHCLVTLFAG